MIRLNARYDSVKQLPMTYETTIPEEYLDSMGHMNVMWYTHIFGKGVVGLFQRVGLTHEFLQTNQGGTFALEFHSRFISEVRVGQKVQVRTRLLGRSSRRFHVLHFMINEDKQNVAATLEGISAYIDMNKRRMAAIPDKVAHEMDLLIEQDGQLDWEAPVCGTLCP